MKGCSTSELRNSAGYQVVYRLRLLFVVDGFAGEGLPVRVSALCRDGENLSTIETREVAVATTFLSLLKVDWIVLER